MKNKHIEVKNLSVFYGSFPALRQINLSLPKNQITAIIGPSGCGKTTLLRSFNRLMEGMKGVKISGEIFVDDQNILNNGIDLIRVRRMMGLISQRPSPLPMSIYENVAFGLRIWNRVPRKELDVIVERYLRVTHLWDEVKDRLKEPASLLSIGQQQRLCLARGLAVEPKVILADEPTSALDPVASQNIEDLFRELKQSYTIIFVTHILRQAKRLADNLVFMYMGEAVESGPSEGIFNSPREALTKKYIQGDIS